MGKYHCTKNDVEDLLGDAVPEDANRNDVLDAVRSAHERVDAVVKRSDTSRVDDDVMAGRLNLATTGLAAHKLLMRSGEMDKDIRLRHTKAIGLLERIDDGYYAADDAEPADNNEPVEDEEGGE